MTLPGSAKNRFTGLSVRNFVLVLLAGLAVCIAAAVLSVRYMERELTSEMERTAHERLVLYSGSLRSALSKYSYLPYLLASHPGIVRLVAEGDNQGVINRYLDEINSVAGSMALFILNREGTVIATSNWNTAESFMGHDYSYRPYFLNAMSMGEGGYFGLGSTTGRPGYFFTQQIRHEGRAIGVAVAKVDLAMLQQQWRDGGETAFITDQHGIIFLTSRDDWLFRATKPLSTAASSSMLYQKQYGDSLPVPIEFMQSRDNGVAILRMGGRNWIYSTQELEDFGWTLWFLSPHILLRQQVETLWLVSFGAVLLCMLLLVSARLGFAWQQAKRSAREAEKIRRVNQRLAEEIGIRKQTEAELLAAQEDLVHAGRMAALGQVAASVAHELSQPVTSMQMFVSSCRRLAKEGAYDRVEETLGHVLSLVQRLKSLIEQLKHFSRKTPEKALPVPVATVIDNALTVLQFKQEAVACTPRVTCPDDAVVLADALHLEQVLTNLVLNALDAVKALPEGSEAGRVSITVAVAEDAVYLHVEDNGPGVDPAIADKIFTPFFTTKKSGEGIGLGLAIVDKLVRSMGGTITMENLSPHGTRFSLRLPPAAAEGVS